jgi:exopolyphosphatase / guanosine-5'-triphosphate,3'-diphosphate pyrophosphatase
MNNMKLAAIDIGSNAIRLLIKQVLIEKGAMKTSKILLLRVPLRLGEDVFKEGRILADKSEKLLKVMQSFKLLMEVNEVVNYRACATSAMREAKNGIEVRDFINFQSEVFIDLISGEEEASLIFSNWKTLGLSVEKTYLYVDVGGGSTEITLLKNGQRVTSKSFKVGAVRLLKSTVKDKVWDDLQDFIKSVVNKDDNIISVGSGGNITKILKESNRNSSDFISYNEIEEIVKLMSSFELEERIERFNLKPNRADVIVLAGEIYLFVMKSAGSINMIVPKIGLGDGIINRLSLKHI